MLQRLQNLRLQKVIYVIIVTVALVTMQTSCSEVRENTFDTIPVHYSESIFPFQGDHVHGSTIVELPNGDLLVGWFQGSGERWADDVKIMGARKKNGRSDWSNPFVLADVKEFPDCNPVLFIDGRDRLWLMWITIIANQWETSLIKYRISEDYLKMEDAPAWSWQDDVLVKPGSKTERGIQPNDSFVVSVNRKLEHYGEYLKATSEPGINSDRWKSFINSTMAKAGGNNMVREGRQYKDDSSYVSTPLGYPYFRRMGWQTRNKPCIIASGRMIVPLYSDGFGFSLMAITDDWGESWKFSEPLVGIGNIQPAIAQTKSGELVAFMRDNGPSPKRIHVSRSVDYGNTWTSVRDSEFPNPGSACDVVTLGTGNWILIYNDTERGRNRLAVALSEDEGKTWPWHKYIISEEVPVQAHYPAIIEGKNDILHISYSYFLPDNQKTIKYAQFNEEWIKSK